MPEKRSRWWVAGDTNAFFGLMLDNIADLLLTVSLLVAVFEFPADFALQTMVPGTAIGVLVGDLLFFWLALRLAKRTGRSDVTAMPLGLDTPSTFGMVFFVLGPAFLHAKNDLALEVAQAARYTWHIGICAIVISGIFKLACAPFCGWVRRVTPRAGLLGSLAAIAVVLISFLPLLEVLHYPFVGLVALSITLTTLVARVRLPFRIPGALGALLVSGAIFYLMYAVGGLFETPLVEISQEPIVWLPTGWLEVFRFQWTQELRDSLAYLPIVLPFALATVVGGIDCTESAAAAGDEYHTETIIGVEALATLVAGLCGGVIQLTPYIGHPAYKAMGGRAGYTLATALFVGGAGLLGYFGVLYMLIPKAAVFPILIFIGLEITSQSFQATRKEHYPAIVLACMPALAALCLLQVNPLVQMIGEDKLDANQQQTLLTLRMLSNGFIVTSLLWASMLAEIIDRHMGRAACYLGAAALLTLFGVIHSPLADGSVFLPTQLDPELRSHMMRYLAGYLGSMAFLLAIGAWRSATGAADGFLSGDAGDADAHP